MFNIKQFLKKEKCCICNKVYYMQALYFKEEKYICKQCKNTFNELNHYYNNDLFNNSNFDQIYESVTKKESIHSIEFNKKLEQHKIAEKQRKEKNNEVFEYNLQCLKIITPKISNTKVPKKALKDIPAIKYKGITEKTPFSVLDNFIVIDVETTGLKPSFDEIIEISAIKFIDFEANECLTTLVKPKKEISPEISEINYITNDMVRNSPQIEYIIQSFSDFIEDFNIVGYNLDFDISFLYKNGMSFFDKKRNYYDVLSICKKYFKNVNLANYKLDTICSYTGFRKNNAHRATADALATGLIFRDIGHLIKDKTM